MDIALMTDISFSPLYLFREIILPIRRLPLLLISPYPFKHLFVRRRGDILDDDLDMGMEQSCS
jgi:hypothetical protein